MNFLNFSPDTLVASLVWGCIGSGFAIYGWKQKEMEFLFGGIAITAVTYFAESALTMSALSVALIAGIFWLRRR